MRIISSFRDYYDPVQAHDADRETIFLREQKKIEILHGVLQLEQRWFNSFRGFYPRVVGFCDKLYYFYRFDDTVRPHNKPEYKIEGAIQWVYNKEEMIHNLSLTRDGKEALAKKDFLKKLKLQNFNVVDIPEAFKQYCPIFYAKQKVFKDEILLNPILSKLTFYRIKDVATAYQEIRMWIENQAAPEKPIPYIDDVTMAEAKGFNKFSFRKDKSNGNRN